MDETSAVTTIASGRYDCSARIFADVEFARRSQNKGIIRNRLGEVLYKETGSKIC